MAIDLLAIEPNKVSRDLSGYITYIFGAAKVGKTTLCSKFPGALILAFEKGYNTLPGVMVQDITRWSEFKEVIRELKKPEVKTVFKSIIIDTIDVAGSLCEKYICNQLGIDNIGDGGWSNNGWAKYKKELEDCFRTITQLGYALVFISHDKDKTFKRKDGSEYNQTVPTAQTSLNNIAKDMADIYAYARLDDVTGERTLVMRSLDNSVECGCRFKYMKPEIPLGYDELVKALNEAIDKEAKENDNKYVTDERTSVKETTEYDYDALMEEFQNIIQPLMQKDPQNNGPKIVSIVEKYLGKGKKIADTTRDQADFVYLIVTELKDTLK
jgi:hypothetical protein